MSFYGENNPKRAFYFGDNSRNATEETFTDSLLQVGSPSENFFLRTHAAFLSNYENAKMKNDRYFSESRQKYTNGSRGGVPKTKEGQWTESFGQKPEKRIDFSRERYNLQSQSHLVYSSSKPSFRLWKKCSATSARTVTSFYDTGSRSSGAMKVKRMGDIVPSCINVGHDAVPVSGDSSLATPNDDLLYSSGLRDSSVPRIESGESSNLSKASARRYTLPDSQKTSRNRVRVSQEQDEHVDKSAAVLRATNAAFEAILPYISWDEAEWLREIIANEPGSAALNAVMKVANSCKGSASTRKKKEESHSVDSFWKSELSNEVSKRNGKREEKELDSALSDFCGLHLNTPVEMSVGSPTASSVGSSISGIYEPARSSNSLASPLFTSSSYHSGYAEFIEPWNLETCATELEELDLLGKTWHGEGSIGELDSKRRSRFFPTTESIHGNGEKGGYQKRYDMKDSSMTNVEHG